METQPVKTKNLDDRPNFWFASEDGVFGFLWLEGS